MKQAGLALLDPALTAPKNWTSSYAITGNFVAALRGQMEFRMAKHLAYLREGRTAVRKRSAQRAEEAQEATITGPQSKAHIDCNGQQRLGTG